MIGICCGKLLEPLKPFMNITKRMQGLAENSKKGALCEVLPSLHYLFTHMERKKESTRL